MTTAKDYLDSALKLLREVRRTFHPFDDNGKVIKISDAETEIKEAAKIIGIELEDAK